MRDSILPTRDGVYELGRTIDLLLTPAVAPGHLGIERDAAHGR
jgi:hypothetical protein